MENEAISNTPVIKSKGKGLATVKAKEKANLPSIFTQMSSMEDLENFVNIVETSETYRTNFIVRVKDEDGILTEKFDRGAVATCLMLGNELGFKPFESIMLARRIGTPEAIVKIHRGRDLGLSPMVALQNIYVFASGGGETIYTSIHVINKCLTNAGVIREVLDDGTKPYYLYYNYDTKEQVDLNDGNYVVVNAGISGEELKQRLAEKAIAVTRRTTRRGLVRLTRGAESVAIPYTLQDAIDANLYAGTTILGEASKGKANWNNHPITHLMKMSIMIGARMIIGDILQGCYIAEELPNIVEDITYNEVD